MKRKLLALLAVLVTALGLGLVVATPASAQLAGDCTSGWSQWFAPPSGPSWGLTRFCYQIDTTEPNPTGLIYWKFQVDDNLTDGYAVHLEACNGGVSGQECAPQVNPPRWQYASPYMIPPSGHSCLQSTGPVVTSPWYTMASYSPWIYSGTGFSRVSIRLVKGRCEGGTYQNAGNFELYLTD